MLLLPLSQVCFLFPWILQEAKGSVGELLLFFYLFVQFLINYNSVMTQKNQVSK